MANKCPPGRLVDDCWPIQWTFVRRLVGVCSPICGRLLAEYCGRLFADLWRFSRRFVGVFVCRFLGVFVRRFVDYLRRLADVSWPIWRTFLCRLLDDCNRRTSKCYPIIGDVPLCKSLEEKPTLRHPLFIAVFECDATLVSERRQLLYES